MQSIPRLGQMRCVSRHVNAVTRLSVRGLGGGGHKVPTAFFSETVKATAIKQICNTN